MKRRRDPIAIASVSKYNKSVSKELRDTKNELVNNINYLVNSYLGKDADLIRNNFIEETKQIDAYLEINDYYSNYMDGVCDYDNETITSVNKELTDIQDSLPKESGNNLFYTANFFGDANKGDEFSE